MPPSVCRSGSGGRSDRALPCGRARAVSRIGLWPQPASRVGRQGQEPEDSGGVSACIGCTRCRPEPYASAAYGAGMSEPAWRRLFDAGRHKTIATLRADGSRRASGIECEFTDGDLRFGSMTGARKGRTSSGIPASPCTARPSTLRWARSRTGRARRRSPDEPSPPARWPRTRRTTGRADVRRRHHRGSDHRTKRRSHPTRR